MPLRIDGLDSQGVNHRPQRGRHVAMGIIEKRAFQPLAVALQNSDKRASL